METYNKVLEKVNRNYQLLAPFLVDKIHDAFEACRREGYEPQVFEGFRSPRRQDVLFSQNVPGKKWVTNARAWQSFHNYGLAFDIAFRDKGKWSWDKSFPWEKVGQIISSHGIEWPKPRGEVGHFQVTGGLSTMECFDIVRTQGTQSLWLIVAEKSGLG